ncbi:hypothetical protein SD81_032705 [Tolypothrix campylonemoides VB511288]|nr:hypothetical protein SD81_032705 [Tolypothrix campylonemoides VB511288]
METNQPLFQAIGIIRGSVTLALELGQTSTVTIQGKTYNLYPVASKKGFRALDALKKELEATGKTEQRLIVYPKITHFPGKDKPHDMAFQLVGFDKGVESEGVTTDLGDFEFKICGLWQFIPVCQTPCISVFKNFTSERLEHVKKSELYKRVKFMKGSHIPILWKDAPVKPFRFNPKLEKEQQGKASFVSVKAKFLPSRNVFGFDSLVALPLEEAPKFFKASKKMKAEALQATREFKKAQGIETAKKAETPVKTEDSVTVRVKKPLPVLKPKKETT